jgi:hypothetical protein
MGVPSSFRFSPVFPVSIDGRTFSVDPFVEFLSYGLPHCHAGLFVISPPGYFKRHHEVPHSEDIQERENLPLSPFGKWKIA